MVDPSLVATAAVAGALLVGVFVAISRTRYHHPTVAGDGAGSAPRVLGRLDRWSTQPSAWVVTFLLVTVGVLGTTVLAVVGENPAGNPLLFVAAAAAAFGVVSGTYSASRSSGLGTAGSILVTGLLLGIVLTLAVAGYLIV